MVTVFLDELVLYEGQEYEESGGCWKMTFSKETKEVVLLSERGAFMFSIGIYPDLHSQKKGSIGKVRYVELNEVVEHVKVL
jgi:hypothetical protein